MADIGARIHELRTLEGLAAGRTAVHGLHPLTKLVSALVFICVAASFGRYDFIRLTPYLFYPFVFMAIAEIPYRHLLKRLLIALPFCLFAGISNVLLERDTAFFLLGIPVSFGLVSLLTILLKTYLCVMSALLLIATTPFHELTAQLRRLRVPYIFVLIFEMTYRYISVLMEEVLSMTTAYSLRSSKKGLDMRHMGSFVGQILLRGFDRAERIYAAMCCRGYSLKDISRSGRVFRALDALVLIAVCALSLAFRFVSFG